MRWRRSGIVRCCAGSVCSRRQISCWTCSMDISRVDAGAAALGVAVWTGAGLVGDWLLLWILRRVRGRRYLRISAFAAVGVYPTFLLAPGYWTKLLLVAALGLLNTGWYAIPKAGLYAALPGRSGAAVAAGGIGGLLGACVPLVLGFVAGASAWRRR